MRHFLVARYWCELKWFEFLYSYASGRERDAKHDYFICPAQDYKWTWYEWQQYRRRAYFALSHARAKYAAMRGPRVLA